MSRQFSSIWYASARKADGMFKMTVFDDRGALDIAPDGIVYQGKKKTIRMHDIEDVSLSIQAVPWVTYILMNVLVVAYLWFMFKDRLHLSVLVVVLVVGNLLGLLVALSTRWVRVEYRDKSNQLQRAYFADGSLLGWGGIFGGTRRLYEGIWRDGPIEEDRDDEGE